MWTTAHEVCGLLKKEFMFKGGLNMKRNMIRLLVCRRIGCGGVGGGSFGHRCVVVCLCFPVEKFSVLCV